MNDRNLKVSFLFVRSDAKKKRKEIRMRRVASLNARPCNATQETPLPISSCLGCLGNRFPVYRTADLGGNR